ncbi:MAG: cysteine desulfurase family protein [candidate division WOR-3 bacterium]|nr:cysteine desulfurase family protein [candidate division WOR-3 bacterium]
MEMIYLDNNATTVTDPAVVDEMRPYFSDYYGNPSSIHSAGSEVKLKIEEARRNIATRIGAEKEEIVFTGSGTESDNLALRGAAYARRAVGKHIIVSAIEHSAILNTAKALQSEGFEISYIKPGKDGIVDYKSLENALRDDTVIVSIMHVNNETGAIQPISEISGLLRKRNILFHTDAVQSTGKMLYEVDILGVDMLTASAHKFHGPKGIGFLYKKKTVAINPIITGGGHELGIRPGTENVPGIIGLAKALDIAYLGHSEFSRRMTKQRQAMLDIISEGVGDFILNTPIEASIENTLNLSFPGIESEALVLMLSDKNIMLSGGSACSSSDSSPSHVLRAMGRNPKESAGSLRISLSRFNTDSEIERAGRTIAECVNKLRKLSPGV